MFGPRVLPGRYTAGLGEEGVVLVLIGMRFNHWWRVDKWWFVFHAMFASLRHLATHEEGLLAHHTWFGRTTLMVQYWRSMDELQAFAANPDAPHLAAWRRYARKIGDDGSVGAYHEAYHVRPGGTDVVYVNMPAFGLGGVGGPVKVDAGRNTARQRVAYHSPSPASRRSEHTESAPPAH